MNPAPLTVVVWAPTAAERRAIAQRCADAGAHVAASASRGDLVLRRLSLADAQAVVVAPSIPSTERERLRADAHTLGLCAAFVRVTEGPLVLDASGEGSPLAPAKPGGAEPPRGGSATTGPRAGVVPIARASAVVISTSTGGPKALATLLGSIPEDFPLPVLIAQHIPGGFAPPLAENLSTRSRLPVRVGAEGEPVRPGVAWLSPGDQHMIVARDEGVPRIGLHRGDKVNNCRPSGDVLLRSAVDVWGDGLVSVVLTGMGHDATEGCRLVRNAGGLVIAQDEATSVVWGMPGSVVREGLAHIELPLEEIGHVLNRRAQASVRSSGLRSLGGHGACVGAREAS